MTGADVTAPAVPMNDFRAQIARRRAELQAAIDRVLDSGWFILGPEVEAFEREYAAFLGVPHAVGVANGMDAITLALEALGVGPGHEVITTPNSAFATALAVVRAGATPVFVRSRIPRPARWTRPGWRRPSPRARGRCCRCTSTATPSTWKRWPAWACRWWATPPRPTARSCAAAMSPATAPPPPPAFTPPRTWVAWATAGWSATGDAGLAAHVRQARDYGQAGKYQHVTLGLNSRLDELQAAILRVKLGHLPEESARRRAIAARYAERLAKLPLVLPRAPAFGESVWHLYTVRTPRRDALQAFLKTQGVTALVHYPIIIPLQPALSHLGHRPGAFPVAERCAAEILSLPIDPALDDARVDAVADAVRRVLRGMKILLCVLYYEPAWAYGGPPRLAYDVARALARRGHQVTVCTTDALDREHRVAVREEVSQGVNVVRFPNLSNALAFHLKIFLPLGMRRWLARRAGEFDVIHLFDTRTMQNAWASAQAVRAGVPFVVSVWGSLPRGEGWRALVKANYDRKHLPRQLGAAAALLAQNDHEAALYRQYGGDPARVVLWPLAVDPEELASLPARGSFRARQGWPASDPLLLFVGRLHQLKGLDMLIEAFAQARARVPQARLVVVGRDDGYLAQMLALARKRGVADRLHFLGPLYGAEVLPAYVDCDLFCIVPHHFEETSLAALTAAACGRPVLINDRCGIPWLADYVAGRT